MTVKQEIEALNSQIKSLCGQISEKDRQHVRADKSDDERKIICEEQRALVRAMVRLQSERDELFAQRGKARFAREISQLGVTKV